MPLVRFTTGLSQVVEQPHVLLVFLGIAGVVLGIFLRIPAGAKGLVARGREDDGDHAAIHGGLSEGEDQLLHGVGRVAVVLRRIVEADPGVVEPAGGSAGGVESGTQLVSDLLEIALRDQGVTLELHGCSLSVQAVGSGTRTARRSSS
jgi:hypothetical protein